MVIQNNLNLRRILVLCGVGRGENNCKSLSLCLFPFTSLSYFLLICSFKMCSENWFPVLIFSVSTNFSGFDFIKWNPLVRFFMQTHWGCECLLTEFRTTINSVIRVHVTSSWALDSCIHGQAIVSPTIMLRDFSDK